MKTEFSNSSKINSWDVIVIGGGATGSGTARDCARRGLRTLMLERHDIATGATGRNHGLLHSGSRYAVTDRESAEECIKENMILKRIASHCVEKTDGLFLTLPEDDITFQSKFIEACHTAGIDAKAIDPKEALQLEPSANPSIIGAVVVPDGTVDPFRLTLSNIMDAKQQGAKIETYHEVLGLIKEQNRVIGVKVLDHITKQEKNLYASVVVNAGGIWGQKIAEYADLKIKMFPAKGSLLIFGHRVNNMVLNRCRKPADSDILVPGDTICLIGTTSTHVPYEEIDNMYVTPEEVDILIREGGKLSPTLLQTRILRGYAGVRPLVASDDDPSGRNVSRGIVLLDHATRDGLEGFITITGGKLMTYRLMAEWATDLVCKKLNNTTPCTTAEENLPGSQQSIEEINQKMISVPATIRKSAIYRLGDMAENLKANQVTATSLVCECEEVSVGEVEYAINELHVNNLIDLRRRTRVGMGTCQGELCACRAAGLMNHYQVLSSDKSKEDLTIFLNERWKGIRPIAWGDTLRESEFTSWVYEGVCGLDMTQEQIKKAKDEI
ncbi:MAG: anaerobic glycerol-3-phosphate dehydrogenase subunit A [Apibacter sp.]|uniref:Glycerol-3-phosphate dehydrogenase n=1 Tax=Apibacter mensalis TaxID=1586267 RepID=A0A0X3AQ66_9FLAO|nr:anaerobic glycerol-3-phosphate dehydrogenase subunit A [Apibacter mensalis]MCO6563952.1 anaerobic glycerol-3-phosphate dehydrogenase subunit A [Apibacter sp.]CVK16393.1 glycerol-3-phosphate dehydrogenase [Apibacter mensalis]